MKNAASLQYVELTELDPDELAAAIALYQDEFDVPWEMPVAQLTALARGENPQGLDAFVLLQNDAVAALAVSLYLLRSDLLWLKYLVVAPTQRGGGLGAIMLAHLARQGERRAELLGHEGCRGVLIEVEMPDGPPPDADRAPRLRRIAFYEREGAVRLGLPLPRPPWALAEMPDWELMLLPGSRWSGNDGLAGRRFLVHALFVEGYGRNPGEEWLRDYLDNLSLLAR